MLEDRTWIKCGWFVDAALVYGPMDPILQYWQSYSYFLQSCAQKTLGTRVLAKK